MPPLAEKLIKQEKRGEERGKKRGETKGAIKSKENKICL